MAHLGIHLNIAPFFAFLSAHSLSFESTLIKQDVRIVKASCVDIVRSCFAQNELPLI